MIEIHAAADLSHPSDRVWHVLTNRGLLAHWFTDAEVVTGAPGRLLLRTAGLPGYDAAVEAEVTDRRAPELIALRCREGDRRTRLTCAITPTAGGCRLSVSEALERGTWSPEQRLGREQYYQQALTGRLPAILDWLAFQQVDLPAGGVATTAEFPVTEVSGDVITPVGRSRLLVLIAVLAGVVLAAGMAGWAVLPADPERTAGPDPVLPLPPAPTARSVPSHSPRATPSRPKPTATTSIAAPSRSLTAKPSGTPTSNPPPAPPVAARYQTVSTRLLGYTGEVVVDNSASAAAQDWTVIVTLSQGGTVTNVSGADWRQDGQAVTFTGPAGRPHTFRFDVRDPELLTNAPEGCTVDGNPCAGL
ncbi:SRPBCC family protein [Micromonospora sp. DT47]|uniref:SRPBCC family protein n=1 Tax=Micromonospora sp. DT47 TaxID=3393431 RepID=UPI003CEE9AA6